MINEIKINDARDILAKVGATGFKVYVDYMFAYNTLNHKPTVEEVANTSTLDKNTIITFVGALKEHGIIKERTDAEERIDIMLEAETDDLLQKNIDTFLNGGCFISNSMRDLCIQTLKDFIDKKIENNPTKTEIYRRSLNKKLELISKI